MTSLGHGVYPSTPHPAVLEPTRPRPQKKVSRTDSPPPLSIRRTGVAHRGKNESGFGSWWLNARSLLVHSPRTMVAEPPTLVCPLGPHLRVGHVRGFAATSNGRRRAL